MKTVAIIQARIGSARLPGKVLMDLAGEPMLARVVERARRSRTVDTVVVATTELPGDNVIAELCAQRGWSCFRGSEDDVLDRYYRTATQYQAEAVVRITADCPFVDPALIDQLADLFHHRKPDYASNGLQRTFPRGLDCEIMTMSTLARAWKEARASHERVHVTPYIYEHPELFRVASMAAPSDYSVHRWTVDTLDDLGFAREVYGRLDARDDFGWRDVLRIVEQEPGLADLNRHIQQKALREG